MDKMNFCHNFIEQLNGKEKHEYKVVDKMKPRIAYFFLLKSI